MVPHANEASARSIMQVTNESNDAAAPAAAATETEADARGEVVNDGMDGSLDGIVPDTPSHDSRPDSPNHSTVGVTDKPGPANAKIRETRNEGDDSDSGQTDEEDDAPRMIEHPGDNASTGVLVQDDPSDDLSTRGQRKRKLPVTSKKVKR